MIARHHYLAQELAKLGHSVTLVGARRHHLLRDPGNAWTLPAAEQKNGYRFLRLDVPNYRHAHDPLRILAWLVFAIKIMLLRRRLDDEPDFIVYSSPHLLGFIGAECLAKACGACLIFEVRDVWPLTLIEIGGHSPKHPFIRFLAWIEKRAYQVADKVVSNLEGAVEHMVSQGMDRSKFVWVPNGVCISATNDAAPLDQAILEKIPADGFRVAYTGTLGLANALETLIEAASLLHDLPDLNIVVAGDGRARRGLEKKCEALGVSNLRFIGAIPKNQIPSFLAHFDACVISTLNSPLYEFGTSPNKIFDYMNAGRPTISLYSGKYDLIVRYNAGIQAPAQDPQACAKAIKTLHAMSARERMDLGKNGRRAILEELNYERLAQRLLSALSDGGVGRKAGAK